MARSDSFFIRANLATDGTNFDQVSIDLGAFVDALGKTVMRIHNVSVSYGTPLDLPNAGKFCMKEGVMNIQSSRKTTSRY